MQYRCLLKWKCPKFPSCSLCNVQLGIRWGSFVVLLWTICPSTFSVLQSLIAIPAASKISVRVTSFYLGLHFCSDTVLSDQHTRPFVFQCCDVCCFFERVRPNEFCLPAVFSKSASSMLLWNGPCSWWYNGFSRWKDHKLGNKSCCNEGYQTCLSSYTYKDQYWDYACFVVFISVSFHY